MNRVTIQQADSVGDVFAAIRSEWKTLFSEVGGSPFVSWEWMSVWFENFGEKKSPYILKAFVDDKLVGILPMFVSNGKIFGMTYNKLSMMGSGIGGADHLDVIAGPAEKPVIARSIIEFLQNAGNRHQLSLENIPADSETLQILRAHNREKNTSFPRLTETTVANCPQIGLADGWEAVLDRSRRKSNFKRKLKQLEKVPGFEYRTISTPSETDSAFERFLALHDKRWEKAGGSELSGHPRLADFQRRVVNELSLAGLIRFDELWAEGNCLASIYGLDDGRAFYYYNSGYDLDRSNLSAGLVLIGLSIKNAIERGNTVYDFLRGDEAYKFDWADRSQDLITIKLSGNAFPVVAHDRIEQCFGQMRKISKAVLPSGTMEIIANWRRAWKRNYVLSGR